MAESNNVPLYAWKGRKEQLESLTEMYTRTKATSFEPIARNLLSLLFNVRQVSNLLSKNFPVETRISFSNHLQRLIDIFSQPSDSLTRESRKAVHKICAGVLSDLKKRSGSNIFSLFCKYATPMFLSLQTLVNLNGDSLYHMSGKLWMLFCILYVRVYIPPICYDPSATARVKFDFLQDAFADSQADILTQMHDQSLDILQSDPAIVMQVELLKTLQDRQRRLLTRIRHRPTPSQMNDIFTQLQYLNGNMLSDAGVKTITKDLENGAYTADKERFMQDTLSAFVANMEAKFSFYRDVIQPVCLGIFYFKYGLHIATRYKLQGEQISSMAEDTFFAFSPFYNRALEEKDSDITSAIAKLDSYYSSASKAVRRSQIAVSGYMFNLSKLHVSSVVVPASLHKFTLLHALLRPLTTFWLTCEKEKHEREAEADQLYKYREREVVILTEDELDEQEVLAHFPDFALDIVEVKDEDGVSSIPISASTNTTIEKHIMPDEIAAEVWLIFEEIVQFWKAGSSRHLLDTNVYRALFPGPILNSFASLSQLWQSSSLH
ncbi:hypothetical protein BC829DRAFT_248759 [Chytridium lagenaria]|nr:hypothetical protein BC829DRAFT_248759 [Chytridium lagenaria]